MQSRNGPKLVASCQLSEDELGSRDSLVHADKIEFYARLMQKNSLGFGHHTSHFLQQVFTRRDQS